MPRQPFIQQIQTRALSSVYGKIEQLLLAYPGGKKDVTKDWVLHRYGGLFKAFSDRVNFLVIGHFGEASDLHEQAKLAFAEALRDSNIDPDQQMVFCHAPMAGSLNTKEHEVHSEFVQDPFLVMETNIGMTVLLESIRQQNSENAYLAEQLAIHAGYLIQPTELMLEGGNILVGDDFALVGKNTFERNFKIAQRIAPGDPERWLKQELMRVLAVRFVLPVGSDEKLDWGTFLSTGPEKMQPFFHLDLFLCLAGSAEAGKEEVLVANLAFDHILNCNADDRKKLDTLAAELDRCKEILRRSGKKFPGPEFKLTEIEIGGEIIVKNGQRTFVPYSYLNAHVECFRGTKRIYLPSFPKMTEMEPDLKASLQYNGFDRVAFIDNSFEDYALRSGSLHCISKVMQRSTPF
jgi:hypothetical protein